MLGNKFLIYTNLLSNGENVALIILSLLSNSILRLDESLKFNVPLPI